MEILLPVLIVIAAIGLAAWWMRATLKGLLHRDTPDASLLMLQNQMQSDARQAAHQSETLQQHLRDELRLLNEQVARALSEANRNMGDRLDNTTRVVGDLRERLGQLDEASKRIFAVGQDIAELQQTLQAPKLRGGFGEYMLAELLTQTLPETRFELQYKFKGGETVDAVIKLNMGLAAIDAKFPLENFKRAGASDNATEQTNAAKQFARDVKKHIDDIARKYIRPDEGTLDFAMMFIPAENVYYTMITRNAGHDAEALCQHALQKRVIPVSPNSCYAYLQTILLGLRGLRVEENAREIMDHLARMRKELDNFTDDFRVIGQHLGNAQKRYEEADKRLERVTIKIEQMSGVSLPEKHNHANGSAPPPAT